MTNNTAFINSCNTFFNNSQSQNGSFFRLFCVTTTICLFSIGFPIDICDSIELENSCVGKEDGEYWLQLDTADLNYMPVYVECSNEYVILDINKDPELLRYFSTFEKWHYAIGGPSNNDAVNWEEWFLPSQRGNNRFNSYLISPDCSSCDETHARQVYDARTTYYMTGNLAKLHWDVVGFNECDMDYDTYQCYDCTECRKISLGCEPMAFEETSEWYLMSGICGVTVQAAAQAVNTERRVAQIQSTSNYKPSIGTDGRFCVCYQPSDPFVASYELTTAQERYMNVKNLEISSSKSNNHDDDFLPFEAEKIELEFAGQGTSERDPLLSIKMHEAGVKSNMVDRRDSNIVYLSHDDFESGTYRIKASGTYIISEDIEFDFNKYDDYWPTSDQSREYPGAASYRDPYHLGFFAGITVECDYVTIDLNGKELKQSLEFYYQQRWFAIIELGNQQFLPGQGPAFFGPDPTTISNIKIFNGVLGRSSHFGIHGNFPSNLIIEDLHIQHFVTHGLQLNGWNNVVLNNIEIGPSSTVEFLRGDYGHARIIAQRLRAIENDMIDDGTVNSKTIAFANRADIHMTITDIADELDAQMEIAFDYALNRARGGLYAENDYVNPKYLYDEISRERVMQAKSKFIHESGFPSSSSITGLFLNFEGSSVFSYTMYTTRQSKHGVLNNIYIHDIYHDMVESLRFSERMASGQNIVTPWNSDIPAEGAIGGFDKAIELHGILFDSVGDSAVKTAALKNFPYVGNAMTDAYYAMSYFSDDWSYLGFMETRFSADDVSMMDWVKGDAAFADTWLFGCNQDVMSHSGKGLLGLRMDGVFDVTLDNIRIENLHDASPLGTMACGNYDRFTPESSGGHFKQSIPMQWGFSGNDLQAMSVISSTDVVLGNVIINNLNNDYSQAYGLSFWTANDVTIKDDALIIVSNIKAGIELDKGSLTYVDKPNRSPEACSIRVEINTASDLYDTYINMNNNGMNNLFSCNVDGHEYCLGDLPSRGAFTMFGNYYENSELCERMVGEVSSVSSGGSGTGTLSFLPELELSRSQEESSKTKESVSSSLSSSEEKKIVGTIEMKGHEMNGLQLLLEITLIGSLFICLTFHCNHKDSCKKEFENESDHVNNEYGSLD